MEEEKKPPIILLPVEFIEDLELLNNEEIGQIILATFNYFINDEKPQFEDRTLKVVFQKIKKIQDDNKIKYKKICERNKSNILKRWNKNEKTLENKGQNDDYTTGYDSLPLDTTGYDWVPDDTNIKYKTKNKNIKLKYKTKIENKNIKSKSKSKKEKEKDDAINGTSSTATLTPTSFNSFSYSLREIVEIGNELGIKENYCKKFYDYYERVGWRTANGEPIKNVKPLLKKWYSQDKNKIPVSELIDNSKEGVKNDTRRIFGDI